MKTNRLSLPGRFLALSLLVSAAGCTKERPATAETEQSKPAPAPAASTSTATAVTPAPAADPCAEMKAALDRATLEQQGGLADAQQRMDREIDAQVAAKKAGANVSLAADEKLDTATEDFAEKIRMLSVARPETWGSAKHAAELALQNVRSSFTEIMQSPPR